MAGNESSGSTTKQEERYPAEWHQARARRLYGVNAHAIAGAVAGERAQNFTETSMKKLVDKFMGHEDTSQPAQPDPELVEE